MSPDKPSVLVISDLFPTPARPVDGIFVKKQCEHLRPYANQVVVVPYRIFPHLRLWQNLTRPAQMRAEWASWLDEIGALPQRAEVGGLPVYYPRYTSLPRQVFHSLWGYFAYAAIHPLLKQLHQIHAFDLIHAHYATPAGTLGLLARRWMRVPVVVSVHGADLAYTLRQKPLGWWIVPGVLRRAEAVLANSAKTVRTLHQLGVAEERLHLVRLGSELPPQPAPAARTDQSHRILSVGYLNQQKGHRFVLEALGNLARQGYDFHYTIVGDGPEAPALRELVQAHGLEGRVTFAGSQPPEQVWPYFAACDLFVLPSWKEAFGLVYIEALSMGKPVIGCMGEGGPEDLHALGDCIELVRPRDVDSLEQALKRLLDDPQRCRQMGETGRRIVAEYYTWQHTAQHTAQIYAQLLQASR